MTLAVVLAAAAGVVLLRREARAFVLCLVGVTVAAFVLARLGGSASPESRHLIFLAPLFAIALAASIVRVGRAGARVLAVAVVAALVVVDVAWAWHRTPALFEWEPDARQAARAEAETWLAATSRPDDVLFGYEPLFLGAWERNRSFPTTVVPRADPRPRAADARARRAGSAAASGCSTPASGTTSGRGSRSTIACRRPRRRSRRGCSGRSS